jgi:hypothetical protein
MGQDSCSRVNRDLVLEHPQRASSNHNQENHQGRLLYLAEPSPYIPYNTHQETNNSTPYKITLILRKATYLKTSWYNNVELDTVELEKKPDGDKKYQESSAKEGKESFFLHGAEQGKPAFVITHSFLGV